MAIAPQKLSVWNGDFFIYGYFGPFLNLFYEFTGVDTIE